MQSFLESDSERHRETGDISSSYQEFSDEALILAIASKEVWAMSPLYQRYNRILFSLAFHMVSDHQIAEDLLQDAFFAVWRHADSYSPQSGSVRAWLLSIIHHRTIDYLRGVRRRASMKDTTLEDVEQDERLAFPDVWEEAWRLVQSSHIRTALLKLSPEQRQVIELAYFEGWTHSEISEEYQIPLGTVKARMRLGLNHLKRTLEQMGVSGL